MELSVESAQYHTPLSTTICYDFLTAYILFTHINSIRLRHTIFFARSNTRIVSSNPSRGMDVCPCFFYVCVVLRRADHRPGGPTNCRQS